MGSSISHSPSNGGKFGKTGKWIKGLAESNEDRCWQVDGEEPEKSTAGDRNQAESWRIKRDARTQKWEENNCFVFGE